MYSKHSWMCSTPRLTHASVGLPGGLAHPLDLLVGLAVRIDTSC